MKDQRLIIFRTGLAKLVESLEAIVRVARWEETEGLPEPLRAVVSQLPERLALCDRLAASQFVGSPRDKNEVTAICKRIKQLDSAYLAYRKRVDRRPDERLQAVAELESELVEASG